MSRLPRLQVGSRYGLPGGPRAVGIPAFGGQLPRADRQAAGMAVRPRADHRSKKSYAGSINGIGRADRARIRQPLTGGGRVPAGPAGSVFPTRLPNRGIAARNAAGAAAARPASGGLLTRIGARMRRAAGL